MESRFVIAFVAGLIKSVTLKACVSDLEVMAVAQDRKVLGSISARVQISAVIIP